MLPSVAPMLASSGPMLASDGAWAFEPKLDGGRVLVYVDGALDVRTRSGRSVTAAVPELGGLAGALAGRAAILDGELVARQGRPDDFYQLAPRLAASRPRAVQRWSSHVPTTVVFFDLLHLDGRDVTQQSYDERRCALESLRLSGRSWCTVASYRSDGVDLLASCAELDLEGVVAKRLSSRYRPGARSRDWIKVKTPMWREDHGPRRHEVARPR